MRVSGTAAAGLSAGDAVIACLLDRPNALLTPIGSGPAAMVAVENSQISRKLIKRSMVLILVFPDDGREQMHDA